MARPALKHRRMSGFLLAQAVLVIGKRGWGIERATASRMRARWQFRTRAGRRRLMHDGLSGIALQPEN
jgi:hypothetical protein